MCSLPEAEEGSQGKQAGGPGHRLGRRGVLDDVLWVDLVLLEDHEDGRVGHAVHTAVVEDVALARLGRGADEGGVASSERAHQHASQEHRVQLRVGFAVMVGIRSISGEVAPCKDTHGLSWTLGGRPQPGRGGSSVLSSRPCQWLLQL